MKIQDTLESDYESSRKYPVKHQRNSNPFNISPHSSLNPVQMESIQLIESLLIKQEYMLS